MARKSYPLLPWLSAVSAVVAVVATLMLISNDLETNPYVVALVVAALLPFLAMAWSRRKAEEPDAPRAAPIDLSGTSRTELQRTLEGLDAAKARGELTEERHRKARERILREMSRRSS